MTRAPAGPRADVHGNRRRHAAGGAVWQVAAAAAAVGQERADRSRAQLGRHRPRAARRPGPRRQPALSDAGAAHARFSLHPQFRPRSLADGLAWRCRGEHHCPPTAAMESNTFVAFADMDASPTKAWLIEHRDDPQWKWNYDFAFAKRPAEELYDLSKDPDQIHNVAADRLMQSRSKSFPSRLMKLLTDAGDPRVTGDGKTFDRPPFTDAGEDPQAKKAKKNKAAK